MTIGTAIMTLLSTAAVVQVAQPLFQKMKIKSKFILTISIFFKYHTFDAPANKNFSTLKPTFSENSVTASIFSEIKS